MVSSLSAGFVAPLRRLLTETSSQCRDEVLRKREEMKSARQQGRNEEKEERKEEEPLLMVEVAGDGQLPEPSLLDEIEVRAPLGIGSIQSRVCLQEETASGPNQTLGFIDQLKVGDSVEMAKCW